MANAFVQRASTVLGFGDTSIVLPSITVTAGSLLVLGVGWSATTVNITGVSDSQGNTWVQGQAKTIGPINAVEGWYAMNAAGGATVVTIALDASATRRRAFLHEVSGAALASALGHAAAQGQTNPGTGTDAVTSGAVVTATDGEYVFGWSCETNADPTYSAGTGFTLGALGTGCIDEYLIQTSAGSVAATMTFNSAIADPTTGVMTFTAAGAGGGPVVRLMLVNLDEDDLYGVPVVG